MNSIDWDNVWGTILVLLVIAVAITLGSFIFATKNIDYYYLTSSQGTGVTCVEQHWTWHPDQHAFCTDDVNKAVDVVTKLNASLLKK